VPVSQSTGAARSLTVLSIVMLPASWPADESSMSIVPSGSSCGTFGAAKSAPSAWTVFVQKSSASTGVSSVKLSW
jgi:hypothetical protein